MTADADRNELRAALLHRMWFGYGVGGLAIVAFVALTGWSFIHLGDLARAPFDTMELQRLGILVGGHVLITFAVALFIYQMLRAGERLSLPHTWVQQVLGSDPTFLRALLGVRNPLALAEKIAEKQIKMAGEIADVAADVAAKFRQPRP